MSSRTSVIVILGLLGCHSSGLQADDHYQLAESYFQAAEFAKCEQECMETMKLNPDHAPAYALLLESQFLQGNGAFTFESEGDGLLEKGYFIHPEQTLIEIDQVFSRGYRSYIFGNYKTAEREFRRILEYSKWMPRNVELETRHQAALEMLKRTKDARRQREMDE